MLRALAKNPADRQSSADDFWAELGGAADTSWPRWREGADLGTLVSQVSLPGPSTPEKGGSHGVHANQNVDAPSTFTGYRVGAGSSTKLPTQRITSPVFAPKKRRRWPGLVAAAVIGVGIAVGLILLTDSSPAVPHLAIESVLVTASPLGVGLCPGSFVLTGHVHTNGGSGTLTYQWSLAGQPLGPVHQTSIRSGETVLDETTRVVASQTDLTSINAVLRVLDPSPQSSNSASLPCTALERS